ncbi:MAG: hypothetical protein AAB347_12515 [Bacteroidota bacterium]
MSTDNDILEIYRSAGQLQEKYIFYIVALCVSAIGFSVYCTIDKPLHYTHIPLGIAVLLWGTSIFSGLNYIKWAIEIKRTNYQKLDVMSDSQLMRQVSFQSIIDILDKKEKSFSNKLQIYFPLQEYSFYSGVVFFIIWHIIEMSFIK